MKKTVQFIVTLSCLALFSTAVQASNKWWDLNGSTDGAGAVAAGTWDNGTTSKWCASSHGSVNSTTFGVDTAIFSANTDLASLAYTVTVSGSVRPINVQVEEGSPTFSGGTIQLGGGTTVSDGSFGGISIQSGGSLIITSQIIGGDGNGQILLRSISGTAGTLRLDTAGTWTGATTIQAGTFKLGANDVIPTSSAVAVTATLDLNGGAGARQTIGGLSGAGTVTTSAAGTPLLTVGNGNASSTFSGAIIDGSGTVALTKTGTGTLWLTGPNTATGAFTVTTGGLVIGDGASAGSVATASIVDKATVIFDRTDTVTYTGAISDAGVVTKNNTGTLKLGGINTYSGATTVSDGRLTGVTGGSCANSTVTVGNGKTLGVEIASAGGTWTCSALTYNASGGAQVFDFGTITPSGTTAPLEVSGTVTFGTTAPTITVTSQDAMGSGNYPLIHYATKAGTTPTSITFSPAGPAGTLSLDTTNKKLILVVTGGAATLEWGPSDGTWSDTGTGWGSAGTTAFNNGDIVKLTDTFSSGAPVIAVNTVVRPSSVLMNSTKHFTLSGTGTITPDSGASGLTKQGAGTLTVAVASTLSGGATLTTGTLNINSTTALGATASAFSIAANTVIDNTSASAITLANNNPQSWNGNFTFTGTKDLNLGTGNVTLGADRVVTVTAGKLTVGGVIDDGASTFALTKSGSGTLTLSGANTFGGNTGGNTRIGDGVLALANALALGTSTLDMNTADSGSLSFGSLTAATIGGLTGIRNLVLENDSSVGVTLTVGNNSANTTYGAGTVTLGILSGAGALTKTGTGTLRLGDGSTPASTYTGNTAINQGSIEIINSDILPAGATKGNLSIASGASLWVGNGITTKINGLSGAGSIKATTGSDSSLVVGMNDQSSTWDGLIQNATGKTMNLTKSGTGTLRMTTVNNFGTGDHVFINAGKIVTTVVNALGAGGIVVAGGTLEIANHSLDSTTLVVTLNNGATVIGSGGASSLYSKSGQPTIGAAGQVTLTADSTDVLTLGGGIAGGDASSTLTKTGTGTLKVTASGTYTGNWTISDGTLLLGNSSALGASASQRTVTHNGGTLELQADANTTFNGDVVVGGNVAVKPNRASNGAGVQDTLGTLKIGANTLTVTAGAAATSGTQTLVYGATTLIGDATFTVNNGAAASTVVSLGVVGETSGPRALTKNGTGALTLNSVNTYTGDTTLSAGKINIDGDGTLGSGAGILHLSGGTLVTTASRTASTDPVPNPVDLTANSAITTTSTSTGASVNFTTATFTFSGSSTLTFRNDCSSASGVFVPRFTAGGFTFSAPIVLDNGSVATTELNAFNTIAAGDQTFSAAISGNGKYRRTGSSAATSGKTIFTAANTYSGGTALASGELAIGISSTGANPPTDGALGTSTVTVSAASSSDARISASGGSRTLGNGISITGGGLKITGSQDLTLAGNIDLGASARTFDVNNTGASLISGIISGAGGGLTKIGTSTLEINNANSYTGDTTVTTGTLKLTGGSAIPNGAGKGNVSVAATLDLNGTSEVINGLTGAGTVNGSSGTPTLTVGDGDATQTFSGIIADAGGTVALTKTGTGTQALSGVNSYTGATTVSGGTLLVNTPGSLAAGGAVTVGSGGTFGGNGTVNCNITVQSSGNLAPGASIGTLTVSGDVTLNGGSTTTVEVDTNGPSADLVTGIGTLTQNGTLQVNNVGNAYYGNESFTLFSATTYAGAFSSISPANPNSDTELLWDSESLRTNGVLKVHHVPFATNTTVVRAKGGSVKIKLSTLFPATDPIDSDAVVLKDYTAGAESAIISNNASYIFYVPASDNNDSFDYTVTDNRGGERTRTITMNVVDSYGVVAITNLGGGSIGLTFHGIPGYNYVIQRGSNVFFTNYVDEFGPITAGAGTGLIEYTDSTPPDPSYYRIRTQ